MHQHRYTSQPRTDPAGLGAAAADRLDVSQAVAGCVPPDCARRAGTVAHDFMLTKLVARAAQRVLHAVYGTISVVAIQ
jgi:hypothetical protein